jgi:hypothetical protein
MSMNEIQKSNPEVSSPRSPHRVASDAKSHEAGKSQA